MKDNAFFYKNYALLVIIACAASTSYVRGTQSAKSEGRFGYPPFFYGNSVDNDVAKVAQTLINVEKEIAEYNKKKQQTPDLFTAEDDKSLKRLHEYAELLKGRMEKCTPAQATKNFIIQGITTTKWDNIRDVDFGDKDLTWSEIASSVKRGIEIEVVSSLARSIGKEVDEGCKSALKPVFNSFKQGCTDLYRVVFKGSKMPFQSHEIMYWSDSIVHSLHLLLESSNDIAGYEDRDRQQRHRNLMLRTISFENDESASPVAESGTDYGPAKGSNTLTDHHNSFATMMIYRCVLPQIDKVIEYMLQRRAYYNEKATTSSVDGQVRDLSAVICHALSVLKQEITKHTNLRDLASPEFKAVLPHYIRYIDELFRLLAQLVKAPGESVEKRTTEENPISYSFSSREGYRHAAGYQLHGV